MSAPLEQPPTVQLCADQKPIVQLQDICLSINGQTLLSHVNLALEPSQIMTIIGPNGAGKSSLLKIVLGLYQPTSGKRSINKRLRVGYMPQKLHLDPSLPLTVERFLSLSGNRNRHDIREAVADVGAQHIVTRPIQSISGGEFQRVLNAKLDPGQGPRDFTGHKSFTAFRAFMVK